MRIGIDCRTILNPEKGEVAGIGHYTYQLVRHLLKIDKKNQYVLFFDRSIKKKKIKKFKKKNTSIKYFPFSQYSKFLPIIYSQFLVTASIAREKLDVFHSPICYLPKSYKGSTVVTLHDLAVFKNPRWFTKKEQAVALMLLAQAEGMHPMRAIQEYHIIQGRPAMRTDAMLARFQRAGGKVTWHELNDKKAKATFEHPQGGKVTIEWTIEMAKRAGLLDKQGSNWLKYPRAMLRARVISEGIRTVFPGVIVGIYTPEEVQDFAEPVEAQVVENGEIINKETGEIVEEKPQEESHHVFCIQ